MHKLLSDKIAIISGAGGGLGSAMAHALASEGAAVVIAEVNTAAGQAVADAITAAGGRALALRCDISDPASVQATVAAAVEAYGGVDILVNNAGIYPSRPWTEIPPEEWDSVFNVNVKGYFLCARAVYDSMRARGGGKIINISSVTFMQGQWDMLLHYVSSKGAVVGLTRALAREVGPDNINVNCIAPGAFPTDAEKIHPDLEAYERRILGAQMLKRRGRPADIANATLFLASPMSDFITGQVLVVDGGWVTH
jgi:NAD(P)-dependent dehydrogenase (short-subunit alcohol dehydrogenase family)